MQEEDEDEEFLYATATALEEKRVVARQDEGGQKAEVSTLRMEKKMVWKKGEAGSTAMNFSHQSGGKV